MTDFTDLPFTIPLPTIASVMGQDGHHVIGGHLPQDVPPVDSDAVLSWAVNIFGGLEEIEQGCGKGWKVAVLWPCEDRHRRFVHDSTGWPRERENKCSRS